MNRKILITLLCLYIISGVAQAQPRLCQPSRHAELPAITGMSYHEARKRLIAKGWQPFQTISHNEAKSNPNATSGNAPIYWAKGYHEVEACSSTGMAPCNFLFKDAYGNTLRVGTSGEELPEQKYFAVTRSFRLVCE